MADEFIYKTQFLQAVKDNNKVCNKQRDIGPETYQRFVKTCLDNGNLPLPILLKIKKGILYIPSSYSITEGLALAMRDAMRHLQHIGRPSLKKAIFDNTNMNDKIFSCVLSGMRTRPEFTSINSIGSNRIGEQTAKELCSMLKRERSDDLPGYLQIPTLRELSLINNKCQP